MAMLGDHRGEIEGATRGGKPRGIVGEKKGRGGVVGLDGD